MDLGKILENDGWTPHGNPFGICGEKSLRIFVKDGQVAVINFQNDSYVVPPFTVTIKKLILQTRAYEPSDEVQTC